MPDQSFSIGKSFIRVNLCAIAIIVAFPDSQQRIGYSYLRQSNFCSLYQAIMYLGAVCILINRYFHRMLIDHVYTSRYARDTNLGSNGIPIFSRRLWR